MINTELLTIYLEDDYTIVTAQSGEEGLDIAAELPFPNLILLDINMPGIDGYETCSRLKSNPVTADIPIVFLTALDHKEEEATGLEAGAVDYISKPIFPETVKARIKIHLALEESESRLKVLKKQITSLQSELHQQKLVKQKLVTMVKIRNLKIADLIRRLT